MKQWYLNQSPRDQKLVLFLGVLVIASLLYVAVWKPLRDGLDTRRSQVEGQRKALSWMRDSAAEVRALGGAPRSGGNSSNKAPYLLVDEAIRGAGLGSPERIEPAGKKGARVQFEAVAFDKLLPMLGQLQERSGLTVSSANFNRRDSGQVSARISLEAGQ